MTRIVSFLSSFFDRFLWLAPGSVFLASLMMVSVLGVSESVYAGTKIKVLSAVSQDYYKCNWDYEDEWINDYVHNIEETFPECGKEGQYCETSYPDGKECVWDSEESAWEEYNLRVKVVLYEGTPSPECSSGNHMAMTFNDGSSPETVCHNSCEYTKTGGISVGMADGSWYQNMKSTGSSCSQADSLPSPDSVDDVSDPSGDQEEPDAPACGDGEQLGTVNGEYSCQPTGGDDGSNDGSDSGSDGGSDDGSSGGSDGGSDDGSNDGSDGGSDSGSDAGTGSGGGSGGNGDGDGEGDGEGVGTPGVDAGDFYESKNPDGVEKVISDFNSEIEKTQLMKSIDGFFDVDINGYSCPVWTIPSVMKMPAITIDQQCSSAMNQIWPGIAAIIIASCGFYAFRIAVL